MKLGAKVVELFDVELFLPCVLGLTPLDEAMGDNEFCGSCRLDWEPLEAPKAPW